MVIECFHPLTLLFYVSNLCFNRGPMAPLFKVIMKYLVVTPLAREEFSVAREAVDRAKEMIMEIIVSCLPTSYWWARIIDMDSGISGIIICPHIGSWLYDGALMFRLYL